MPTQPLSLSSPTGTPTPTPLDTTANAQISDAKDPAAVPMDEQIAPLPPRETLSFPSTPKPATMTARYIRECFQKLEIGYVAKPILVPSDWSEFFDAIIFPKLDKHVQRTIVTKYGMKDIIRLTRYRMFGKKKKDKVDLNATILIGCTDNKCVKYLKKSFSVNELAYLKHFDQPRKVYLEDVRYGAVSRPGDEASQHFNEGTVSESRLEIERTPDRSLVCGAQLKLTSDVHASREGLASRHAVIGGTICLGAHHYGLTTGHPFVADSSLLEMEGDTGTLEVNSSDSDDERPMQDSPSSSPVSSDDGESEHRARHFPPRDFIPLYQSTLECLAYSFLNWEKPFGYQRHRSLLSRNADWAIIRLSESYVCENSYKVAGKRVFISSLAADSEMVPGYVHVLCAADTPLAGTLIADKSYVQTTSGTMTVLEIAMDSPLPYGYSGCWVVRGEKLLGHLVASSSSGLHCFMAPMVQTFRSIADLTGTIPNLAAPQLSASTPPPQVNADASALESPAPSKLAGDIQAPSYATVPSANRARVMVSEKVSGVMYTAEVYHLHKSPDGKDAARLHERFEYGEPIKVIKSEDELERGSSIFQVTTIYAAPSISRIESGGFDNARQTTTVNVSGMQGEGILSHPQAEVSGGERADPPLYYSPDNPIVVRAKVGTRIYIRSHAILEVLESIVSTRDELKYENGAMVVSEPFCVLFHYESELRALSTSPMCTSTQCSHLNALLNFLSSQYTDDLRTLREEIGKNACCTFEWAWLLFRPGTIVHSWQNGKVVACVVDSYSLRGLEDIEATAFNTRRDLHFGDKLEAIELRLYFLEFDGEFMGRRSANVTLWPFGGKQAIKSLPVYPIEYDERSIHDDLIQKGNLYWQTTQRQHYSYDGPLLSNPRRNLHGRVFVDMQTYYAEEDLGMLDTPRLTVRHDSSIDKLDDLSRSMIKSIWQPASFESVREYRKSMRSAYERSKFKPVSQSKALEIVDPSEYLNALKSSTVPDGIAMISARQVYGFILRENHWEALDIDYLRPIQFNLDLFDGLVLPDITKRFLRILINKFRIASKVSPSGEPLHAVDENLRMVARHPRNSFVTLLHGPPGVGKTMTTECVAEAAGRPLLRLTVKELGTQAAQLERSLTFWMRLATLWQAVLVLDEADVYLESRARGHLEQNGLVSVFLQLMESYDGLFFLITNRVGLIDEAFISRIQLHIYYPPFDKKLRVALWEQLFRNLEESRSGMTVSSDARRYCIVSDKVRNEKFLKAEFSGREIVNIFNMAISMAEQDRDSKIEKRHIEAAVASAVDFSRYHSDLTDEGCEDRTKIDGLRNDKWGNWLQPLRENED